MEEKKEKKSFEKAMEELKSIVERLESKDLPLEEAVGMFEQGIELVSYCQGLLDEAETKVKLLMKDDKTGQVVEKDFDQMEN